MSSTAPASALSRTRSLRKPTKSETASGGERERNASPSRLPVGPGQTRLTRSATTSAATKGSRPLSGVFARMTSAAARQREKDSPAPETSPPGRLARASSIRQPSTSTRATPGSVTTAGVRPTTSSGVPASRRAVSGASTADAGPGPGIRHMRAKSSVTSLSSATTLRPPSQTSTTGSSTAITADRPRPPRSTITRRPLSIAGPPSSTGTGTPHHRRIPSNPSLTPSTPRALPPPPPPPKQSQLNKPLPAPPSLHPRPRTNTNPPPPPSTTTTTTTSTTTLKPTFTTHQQHFTPSKTPHPKPPTASYLAPPSPSKQPLNMALSAETARLQTELLQLHLLHRDSRGALAAWRGSARGKLAGRFEGVRGAEGEVGGLEGVGEEGRGVGVLLGWGGVVVVGGRGRGDDGRGVDMGLLEEKVMVLDAVLSGLWGVGEPGGRYGRVVGVFEGWVEQVERVMEARRRDGEGFEEQQQQQLFIPSLPAPWREECASLLRRLDDWRRKLRELGDAPALPTSPEGEGDGGDDTMKSSSLGRILAGCRALVHGMLAELETMELIEREAVAAEMRWVKEVNRGMDEGAPRAGAIWRAL